MKYLITSKENKRMRAGIMFGKKPITMSDDDKRMSELKKDPYLRISPIETSDSEEENMDLSERAFAIDLAIKNMQRADPDKQKKGWWTEKGLPELKQLRQSSEIADISAAERNLAAKRLA